MPRLLVSSFTCRVEPLVACNMAKPARRGRGVHSWVDICPQQRVAVETSQPCGYDELRRYLMDPFAPAKTMLCCVSVSAWLIEIEQGNMDYKYTCMRLCAGDLTSSSSFFFFFEMDRLTMAKQRNRYPTSSSRQVSTVPGEAEIETELTNQPRTRCGLCVRWTHYSAQSTDSGGVRPSEDFSLHQLMAQLISTLRPVLKILPGPSWRCRSSFPRLVGLGNEPNQTSTPFARHHLTPEDRLSTVVPACHYNRSRSKKIWSLVAAFSSSSSNLT